MLLETEWWGRNSEPEEAKEGLWEANGGSWVCGLSNEADGHAISEERTRTGQAAGGWHPGEGQVPNPREAQNSTDNQPPALPGPRGGPRGSEGVTARARGQIGTRRHPATTLGALQERPGGWGDSRGMVGRWEKGKKSFWDRVHHRGAPASLL